MATAIVCLGVGLLTCTSACNGAETACTDANVQLIQTSNYDQSCKLDSDCVSVSEGNACLPCVVACQTGTINRCALPRYQNDISKTIGFSEMGGVRCHCPLELNPCCRGGVCHADLECSGGVQSSTASRADGGAIDAQE
jgi:hypothetical protein